MGVASFLVASVLGVQFLAVETTRWFPGEYFDSHVRQDLRRDAMQGWPGPGQLLSVWNEEKLDEKSRVTFLLGAAVFHDPLLLPVYREALTSPSQRVRQAAVYGYRDLLADSLVDVRHGIGDDVAGLLVEEIDLIDATLRTRSMVQFWLNSLLANEGLELPGWNGLTFKRGESVCLRAVEQLMDFEDLNDLLTAYDISGEMVIRMRLLRLIEAISLSRLVQMPQDRSKGWGQNVYDDAMNRLAGLQRKWSSSGCVVDGEWVVQQNLASMGAGGIQLQSTEACFVWLNALQQGPSQWWRFAARRLYECGGPWLEFSALSPDSERNSLLRKALLDWFRPLREPVTVSERRRPPTPYVRRYNE